MLIAQGIFGDFAPVIGGADNDPVCEGFFTGGRKKAVDVLFLNAIVVCVKLALNGVDFA